MAIRVKPGGEWSEPFLVDAVGNSGTVTSHLRDKFGFEKHYEIGVDVQLSANGLTKIIKLTPYFLLINDTEVKN